MALIIELAKQVQLLMLESGVIATNVANLSLVRSDHIMQNRSPVVYEPCIYIVVQGKKIAFLGNDAYAYDALNYLVLSVSLPLECQVLKASKQEPYLAIKIDINITMLTELIQETNYVRQVEKADEQRGIYVTNLGDNLRATLERLLSYANDPSSAKVLGPLAIKEVLFHVLQGEQGEQLKTFVYRDRHNHQIAQVIHFIQKNYSENMEIAQLASRANMSQSSFHQYFKAVTSFSPLQYIKAIRLHAARRKMLYDNHSASDAAYHVGYASPSQFSREYRRLFGVPPSIDVQESING